jgi:hypothetical protein
VTATLPPLRGFPMPADRHPYELRYDPVKPTEFRSDRPVPADPRETWAGTHGRNCPCTPCRAEDWDAVEAGIAAARPVPAGHEQASTILTRFIWGTALHEPVTRNEAQRTLDALVAALAAAEERTEELVAALRGYFDQKTGYEDLRAALNRLDEWEPS